MIDFFFGKPRTGKTYRAMNIIYNDYIIAKAKPKYPNILTNIGGFKFDDINEHFKLDYEDKIASCNTDIDKKKIKLYSAKKLVWADFYNHLCELYEMAINQNKDDDILNLYADKHNINDALIVIDEASFYMKKYNDVISWWLAYHGHFRIRIIMIAQSPKQIYREYMEHTELYYEAQPQSKQLKSNKFRYIIYDDYTFGKDTKYGSSSLVSSQSVFDLYKSGEVDKPKKMLYKFLFMMLIAILVMFGFWKFLIYRLSPDSSDVVENSTISSVNYSSDNSLDTNDAYLDNDTFLFNIRCNDAYCWNNNLKYLDNQISLDYFLYIVEKFNLTLEYYEVKNEIYKLIPQKKGLKKVTLASLTDFYYEVPKNLKKSYLSSLFIEKEISTYKLKSNIKSDLFFKNNDRISE